MIRRILFLGDLERPSQADNTNKMYYLFSSIFYNTSISLEVYISPINRNGSCTENVNNWIKSNTNVNNLNNINLENCAIIGFELPPQYIIYFNKKSIPWINIEIHPVRFLNDLCLSISSSFKYDHEKNSINDNEIKFAADRFIINEGTFLPKKSNLLIIGQTPFDKSVWFDNQFKTILNYQDKLNDISSKFDKIFYKPHPYLSNNETDRIIVDKYNAEYCTESNIYKFFSSGMISAITGISSSCLHEAPYFNIKSTFLEERIKNFGKPIRYSSLMNDHLFWFDNFLHIKNQNKKNNFDVQITPNYLRDIFGYWAYPSMQNEQKFKMDKNQKELIDYLDQIKHLIEKNNTIEALNSEVANLHEIIHQKDLLIKNIYNSTSWKISKPIRIFKRIFIFGKAINHTRDVGKRLLPYAITFLKNHPRIKKYFLNICNRFGLMRLIAKLYYSTKKSTHTDISKPYLTKRGAEIFKLLNNKKIED